MARLPPQYQAVPRSQMDLNIAIYGVMPLLKIRRSLMI